MNFNRIDCHFDQYTQIQQDFNTSFEQKMIDVILINDDEIEMIPNLGIEVYDNNLIDLQKIIEYLKFMGFQLHNSFIQLKNDDKQFETLGQEPLTINNFIIYNNQNNYNKNHQITIQYQHFNHNFDEMSDIESAECSTNNSVIKNSFQIKRVKERKISEVLYKVALWRNLYSGYQRDGPYMQMNLEKAAQFVKVSKKTLDDYLLQIRLGKKYGFDFKKYFNEKIGILRCFVRKQREQEKNLNNNQIKRCNFKEIDLDLTNFLRNISCDFEQPNQQYCF